VRQAGPHEAEFLNGSNGMNRVRLRHRRVKALRQLTHGGGQPHGAGCAVWEQDAPLMSIPEITSWVDLQLDERVGC
jgi:hypothetical protein